MPENHDLHRMLGEIHSDVKHILLKQADQSERLDRQEARMRGLEQAKARMYGALAVMPTAFGAAIAWLKYST